MKYFELFLIGSFIINLFVSDSFHGAMGWICAITAATTSFLRRYYP